MTAQTLAPPPPRSALAAWAHAAREWAYAGGKRDLRLDFLRGFAVFAMVVDHIGGWRSPFYLVTGGDRFFTSAAEAFVFLSGLLMGVVNGGMIRRGDVQDALTRVLRRAGLLYTITVSLTLLIAVFPIALNLSWAPDLQGESLADYIVGVFTLHRTAQLIDVMLLYTVLVLAAEPILLLLEHGRTRLVLIGSWGLWALWQGWPRAADLWPIPGDELFTVSAWQLLFVNALVIGYHRRRLDAAFRAVGSLRGLLLAGAALAGLIALHFANLAPLIALTGRDQATLVEWLFAKNDVAPGRVVAFAAFFAFAYAAATLAWRPLHRALGWLLLPLGQNALSAYVIHLFVVGAFNWLHPRLFGDSETVVTAALYQFAAVLLVWWAIRVRPQLATSLERLESAWAAYPPDPHTPALAIATDTALSVDVQLAQAEARRGIDLLR